MLEQAAANSLVKSVGQPDNIAEAYIFCMKYVLHHCTLEPCPDHAHAGVVISLNKGPSWMEVRGAYSDVDE